MRNPTRDEIVYAATEAARHMSKQDRERIVEAVQRMKVVVYGADYFANSCCPLIAAGYERIPGTQHQPSGWRVRGGAGFTEIFDSRMRALVGLLGPCAVGIAASGQEQASS